MKKIKKTQVLHKKCNKKQLFLTICLFFLLIIPASGQLEMDSDGKVSIGGAVPHSTTNLLIRNESIPPPTPPFYFNSSYTGLNSTFNNISENHLFLLGIYGRATHNQAQTFGRGYGVHGYASNYSLNYGTIGRMYGDNDGAGIFGIFHDTPMFGLPAITGQYAGYFYGDVYVDGVLSIYGQTVSTSDERLKENIISLNQNREALKNLTKLNPITYQYKPIKSLFYECDTTDIEHRVDPKLLNRDHFGFIAQEFKEVYPDLVYENGFGVMSINYTGLIPLLVKAYTEQQGRIEYLERGGKKTSKESDKIIETLERRITKLEKDLEILKAQCCGEMDILNNSGESKSATGSNENIEIGQKPVLYQNTPNPFNQSTDIRFEIPENVNKAMLYIYDMQGVEISSYAINDRGNSSIEIQGNELKPGMYLYTLIVDGKEIDTKRMILTE